MVRASSEQRTDKFYNDEPWSRRLTWQWANRIPTDTSCRQACVRLRDCRKPLNECPIKWHILCLAIYIAETVHC
jgi:hypothetical protein